MNKNNIKPVKIREFSNSNIAINYLLRNDSFVQDEHPFKAGEYVEPHFHPNATEWVIVDKGKFILSVDFKEKTYDISKTTAFEIPAGRIHSLRTITPVSYNVLRNMNDKLLDLEDLTETYHKTHPKMEFLKPIYSDKNMHLLLFRVAANGSIEIGKFSGNTLYFANSGEGGFFTSTNGGNEKTFIKGSSLNSKTPVWTNLEGIHGIENYNRIPLEGIVVNYKNN